MKQELKSKWMNGYEQCECGGLVETDSEWLGEDENGKGWFMMYDRCEDCGNYRHERRPE